jgi:formylglycine-generating enzyme required for sulfatase activity
MFARRVSFAAAVVFAVAGTAAAGGSKCPPDSVAVGTLCMDTYEASVWQVPVASTQLVKKIQSGKATLADLTAGGATQVGVAGHTNCSNEPYPANFPVTGQWTPAAGSNPPSAGVYAVSIAGVNPSSCISWFQAAQACRFSGKRLPTNLEWQDAAAGTPDVDDDGSTTCATNVFPLAAPVQTGSRSACRSSWGTFDMVGNMGEWVADWADFSTTPCSDWTTQNGTPGSDHACYGGDGTIKIPAALVRGGAWSTGQFAGPLAVDTSDPTGQFISGGFRCAR